MATVPAEVAPMPRDFDALISVVCAVFNLLLPFLGVVVGFFDVLASVVAAAFSGVEVLLVVMFFSSSLAVCCALVFAMMWMMMLACG